MSDVVITQDPKVTQEADALIEELKGSPSIYNHGTPYWGSSALRHAFERGVAWAQAVQPGPIDPKKLEDNF